MVGIGDLATLFPFSQIVSPEQLRIFCILPELSSLHFPTDYVPQFCRAILDLPAAAQDTLRNWYASLGE